MSLSLNRLSLKAPPPRVVLLPDHLFFVRSVPVSESAAEADVSAQIELALEGLAPFPLAQMYYGYRWMPGSKHALVYACYRKRFSTEETDTWPDADVVLPRFAALLGAKVEGSTTLVNTNPEGITAIHWGENGAVPTDVLTRTWSADTGELERGPARDEIIRQIGGTKRTIETNVEPTGSRDGGSSDIVFKAGEIESVFNREQLDALDVRDKTELSDRRKARSRDLLMWRTFLVCVGALVLAALLEVGVIGGRFWEKSREKRVERQSPVVADIMRLQSIATRIQELSTNRLRPFEMIALAQSKQPASVTFSRATTSGLYKLEVEAYTANPADVGVYQSGLRSLPQLSQVDIQNQVSRDGISSFRLVITVRPEAFR